ncbi:MAG: CinA family protein [Micrococcus sp.]|nr:CinA family protein [Micrococcus sp.]
MADITDGKDPGLGSTLQRLIAALVHRGISIATAESLTAGQLAAHLADVPGASAVLDGGVVAYQSRIKREVLGVPGELLECRGAVDPEVALEMARGARAVFRCGLGIATTGVAGPEPHEGKEVGTVMIAVVGSLSRNPDEAESVRAVRELHLEGDRAEIRHATVRACVELVGDVLTGVTPA